MEPAEKPTTLPKNRFSEFFNDMSGAPKRNYTLGEAFQHYVQGKPFAEINDNKLEFSKAGRMVERLHMAAGVLSAALVITAAPAALLSYGIAAAFIALYKTQGLAGGKQADMAVRGTLRAPKPPTAGGTVP
ncbi:MAG: hypothetical protein ACAH80_10195 [Alphaproteobacteria bacterium]